MGTSSRSLRGLIVGAVFASSAVATVVWCSSMASGMAMPGNWMMSMAWMRMPEQTWLGAAASFICMWALMMIAMMLPAIAPVLLGHRRPLRVALAYFAVWTGVGAAIYPLGVALAMLEMRSNAVSRAVPIASACVIVAAGAWQLTRSKLRALARSRDRACCAIGRRPSGRDAWADGLRLGARCVRCCAAPLAVLVAGGVMAISVMAAVFVAITAERWAARPRAVVRAAGVAAIVAGVGSAIGWR